VKSQGSSCWTNQSTAKSWKRSCSSAGRRETRWPGLVPQGREPLPASWPEAGEGAGCYLPLRSSSAWLISASQSTSHCQLVHLWCDPLPTLFCTSDFIPVLSLVLCSPMKTD